MAAILDLKVIVAMNVQNKVRNGFLVLKLARKHPSFVFLGPLVMKIHFCCGPRRPYWKWTSPGYSPQNQSLPKPFFKARGPSSLNQISASFIAIRDSTHVAKISALWSCATFAN